MSKLSEPKSAPQQAGKTIERPLKVVHMAVYPENAYQPLLMKSLADRGLEIIDGGGGGNFLRTALFRWKADLFHFHWLHPYVLRTKRIASLVRATRFILEVLLIRLSGARIVWTVHNLVNHDLRFPAMERFFSAVFALLADGLILHSDHGLLEARRVFRVSRRKPTAVIPQGSYVGHYPNHMARAECRATLALPADDFVFLFLGRIERYKGVLELIRCFQEMSGGAWLIIAGRSSDADFISRLREEIDGTDRIRFDERFVPDGELQTYFNAVDAFVFPVRDILNSSSISLAMSFGLACVAPALEGIKDMLGNDGGIFYDPGDPRGLAIAMEKAIERREELATIGRGNLRRARENSWDTVAARTDAFYDSMLRKPRTSRQLRYL